MNCQKVRALILLQKTPWKNLCKGKEWAIYANRSCKLSRNIKRGIWFNTIHSAGFSGASIQSLVLFLSSLSLDHLLISSPLPHSYTRYLALAGKRSSWISFHIRSREISTHWRRNRACTNRLPHQNFISGMSRIQETAVTNDGTS